MDVQPEHPGWAVERAHALENAMYTLFYLLGYLAVLGFICLAIMRIYNYKKSSPLHIRWELYPVPHEGPKKYAYGGSYMEESNWWTKPRHIDHALEIKEMLKEIIFLHSTFEHNLGLWVRTYPFHMGLYMLMGGIMIVLFAVILLLCGVSPYNGFLIFLGNIINACSLFGALGITCGGIGLIHKRLKDKGLRKYTTPEMFCNLGSFVIFGIVTLLAWIFNPSYSFLCQNYLYNLCTGNFSPLGSGWFVLNMLLGYAIVIWIPLTNMRHLLIKYFMYHNIRWGDEATVWSNKNKHLIDENLQFNVDWAAPHIEDDGKVHNWVEVATSNPADQKKD